jgi:hypothetical protein
VLRCLLVFSLPLASPPDTPSPQIGRDDGQLHVYANVDSVFRPIQTQSVGESIRGIAVGEVRQQQCPMCPCPACARVNTAVGARGSRL